MDSSPSSSISPVGKGIVGLFYIWLVCFLGAWVALVAITPTGDGLNRAVPTVSLLGLSVVLSIVCAVRTRLCRKSLRKRSKSLGYLPLLMTMLTFLSLIDYILRGDDAVVDPLSPAGPSPGEMRPALDPER